MASVVLRAGESNIVPGLGTSTFTAVVAGAYLINVGTTVVPPSGLSIVVKQNTTTIFTAPAPTVHDKVVKVIVPAELAIGDVVSVILSSTNLQDAPLNNIKSTINIGLINGNV